MKNRTPYLTKSRYMQGLACQKWLWLGWHEPLPYEEPEEGSVQAAGTAIGVHATKLFPNGVLIDQEAWEHKQAIERTTRLVADDKVSSIYEAAFEFDNVRIRVDILERLPDGYWGIREVKSSTSVKDDYINDIAIQLYVLEGCNIPINSIELVHVNNQYVYQGGDIDWSQFFIRADCRDQVVEQVKQVPQQVKRLHKVMRREGSPDISAGPRCSRYCPYWDHCSADKPKEDWILTLPRLSAKQFDKLEAAGIEQIKDIPDDFPLNVTQGVVRQAWLTGQDFISDDLRVGLKDFGPPAYYLDFETINPAIPLYEGTRPFQRQPFQWSLHFDDGAGDLKHWEYLGENSGDPRRAFSETLIEFCGQNCLPIIVYSSFERSVIGEMAALYPDLTDGLNSIIDRLKDLLPISRNYTYFRDYKGSFSIKAVGPTLAPSVSYKDLELIDNGGAASTTFALISGGYITDLEQIEKLRSALLAYCKLDTLAMVEVHRAFNSFVL